MRWRNDASARHRLPAHTPEGSGAKALVGMGFTSCTESDLRVGMGMLSTLGSLADLVSGTVC